MWLTHIYAYKAENKSEERCESICPKLGGKIIKLYLQSPQDYYKNIENKDYNNRSQFQMIPLWTQKEHIAKLYVVDFNEWIQNGMCKKENSVRCLVLNN